MFRDTGGDGTRGPLYGGEHRHLRRARPTARRAPRLVREGGTRPVVRRDRQAHLRQRLPPGQGRPRQRRHRRSGLTAVRRRRRRPLPVRQRDADRAVARRQVGRVRGAVARVRRAVPAHRPAGRFEPDDGGLSDGAHLAGRGLQHPLVRRQPRRSTGRWAPSSSRATSAQTFTFLDAQPRRRRIEPEAKGVNISFTAKADVPAGAIALVGARIITAAGDTVIENGTVVVEGNRITAVGRGVAIPAGAKQIDVARQDDHAGHHRRPRARRRRRGRHPRASELAAAGEPRVRRHDVARSVERHRDRVQQRRADPRRDEARPAAVLDRDDPLRRGNAVQGDRQRTTTMRCRRCGGRRRSAPSA